MQSRTILQNQKRMEAPIGQIPLTEVQWKKELGDKYFNEISNYKIYIYFIY